MSSILEALRELEEDRNRGADRKGTSVTDALREPARSVGTFIPLTGGLAIGVVAFGLCIWGSGILGSRTPEVPRGDDTAPASVPTPGRSSPAWLENADPPRARVDPPPMAAPAEHAAAEQPSALVAPPSPPVTKAAPAGGGDRQVDVESIRFSPHFEQRTVTLRVSGRRATLRQGESIGGVEDQLMMADGVYLQRGSEVLFITARR